ncbi:MAG TPA: hypothetical protein VFC19_14050 [Candidatus Limnocylindrales bacterium]|nr:hypothetical protein [Candidatus Limnocylindrales bacterium]
MSVLRLMTLTTAMVLLGGCSPGGTTTPTASPAISPAASPAISPRSVELTASAPTARIPVEPVRDAKALRINIISINNQARQGVQLSVSIRREGGAAVPVGTAGPFPVDHPSELRLPLTPAMAEVALGPRPEVTVELASALPEQPLNPQIKLTVAVSVTA